MATGLKTVLTALLLCAVQIATAESLPDPTRPAIDLRAGDSADVVSAEVAPPGLQSVIISPKYSAAIINGEMVVLGGKSGDSTLVEVREGSVVLQNAAGKRVLELFPRMGISKNRAGLQEVHGNGKTSERTNLPE